MGYTRYWMRPRTLDRGTFALFAEECQKLAAESVITIESAVFNQDLVFFRGVPGCEDFSIEATSTGRVRDGVVFEFCKTEQLPYDQLVEACLRLLQKHFPDDVELPRPS